MKKIILFIIAICVLFLLIHASFLSKNNSSFEEIKNIEVRLGAYSFDVGDGGFIYSDFDQNNELNINYINHLDKILYNGELEIDNSIINLGKGIYTLNIIDLNSSYIINGPGFQIKNTGPTNIYIDTSSARTTIFSQNNVMKVSLIDQQSNEFVNEISLYPHMYIKFTPSLNKNVNGADILKLTQWFPIDYFPEQVITSNSLSQNFISKIIGNNHEKINIIQKMFLYLDGNENNDKNYIDLLKNNEFGSIVGERFIQEYSKIFLNDAKRVVYNKNLIIRTIGGLINSSNENANTQIKLILDTMKDIKKISQEDYDEMKNIIYFYSSIIVSQSSDINSKENFSSLYNSLEGKNINTINSYILNLNNIYQKLDFERDVSEADKYNNMYINLAMVNKELILKELTDNEKSYLVLYLNKIIITGFNLNVPVNNIIKNFNNYINLSVQYYASNDDIRIRTGIAEYSKVLDELLSNIRNYFFLPDKNSDGLLVPNNTNNISTSEVTILKNNFDWILSYFNDNKSKLWDKESSTYIASFEKSNLLANEYILALEDYNIYVANTKEQDWELLFGDKNNGDALVLSKENAFNYLEQFNYLNLTNTNIYLRDINYCNYNGEDVELGEDGIAYCYKIENVVLNNSIRLDFILVPNDYNRISNIIVNGDSTKNKGSYRLDREEETWKKLFESNSTGENSNRYNFKNYFYYTFGDQPSVNIEVGNNNENQTFTPAEIQNETATIKMFKSILLGNTGELYSLSGFIDATYNNVLVKEIQGGYDIRIENAILQYINKGKSYSGTFSSKYIHSPEFVFENSEITLKNSEGKNVLLGNKIIFEGRYKTKEFQADLLPFFNNIDNLEKNLNLISQYLNVTKMTITYSDIGANKLSIEGENFKFVIDGYLVKSILINGKEMLSKDISIFQLESTLQSLN